MSNPPGKEPYAAPHSCEWFDDIANGAFQTACGRLFTFIDDGPTENKCRFCCYCGGNLIEIEPPPAEDGL